MKITISVSKTKIGTVLFTYWGKLCRGNATQLSSYINSMSGARGALKSPESYLQTLTSPAHVDMAAEEADRFLINP